MGIDAGVQQKEQQGKHGNPTIIEQPASQPVAAVSPEDKEQVGSQNPQEVNMVGMPQAQGPLPQEQGQLEGNAISAVRRKADFQSVGIANDVVQVADGDQPLQRLILVDAIVPGGEQAQQQKQATDQQAAVGSQKVPPGPAAAGPVGKRTG